MMRVSARVPMKKRAKIAYEREKAVRDIFSADIELEFSRPTHFNNNKKERMWLHKTMRDVQSTEKAQHLESTV